MKAPGGFMLYHHAMVPPALETSELLRRVGGGIQPFVHQVGGMVPSPVDKIAVYFIGLYVAILAAVRVCDGVGRLVERTTQLVKDLIKLRKALVELLRRRKRK
jgi:hypothetical protein